MRIPCPINGDRDIREFTYQGAASMLQRPSEDAPASAWDAYLHLRENPAGETEELWYHDPSGTWLVVRRNTVTHEVLGARLAKEARP